MFLSIFFESYDLFNFFTKMTGYTNEQDFEVQQHIQQILSKCKKKSPKLLGGSRGRLGRVRPQQSGRGCLWGSPGHFLIDSAWPRPPGVVLTAEHHRS